MKYKSKPKVIEAIKYVRTNIEEVEKFGNGRVHVEIISGRLGEFAMCFVDTRNGRLQARVGDYIIKDVANNDYYPCSPDIFEKRYEPCEE